MIYEIVQFQNNSFGIRRRNFFENLFNFGGDYFDLKSNWQYFWSYKSSYFRDCHTLDINLLLNKFEEINNPIIKHVFKNGLPNSKK